MGNRSFSGLEISLMVMFVLVGVVAVALIVLLATSDQGKAVHVAECPNIPHGERVDCFPETGASQQRCLDRGCCWSPLDEINVPWCVFSSNHGYTVVSESQPSSTKKEARLRRMDSPSLYGADIMELSFIAEMQTENRLRFKITDAHNPRFEVPHEHIRSLTSSPSGPLKYRIDIVKNPFAVKVSRVSNNKVLFDTSMGPLVFDNQYLQVSAKLPSANVYGLGEHVHQNFRHSMDWRTWPIFSRDGFPNGGTHNLYGHYPFFMCLEDNSGSSFGVFLMNSNAMDVTLQPAPAVTYRTIGGVLDFYIMLGDTPEAIVQEFTELVGRPTLPPYWSLGFQLSRWDYGSLDAVKRVVDRNRAIGIPYEAQYTDIDYMEHKKDFTYDKQNFTDLPLFADYMHQHNQKYILILDPAIAISNRVNGTYEARDRGYSAEAWVTEADGKTPLVGEVWPGATVFPDYTKRSCINWWVDEIARFHAEVKHDAIWIDMNEVSSFVKGSNKGCADNMLNYPPYTPKILDGVMFSKTLCMDAKQAWGNHYDVHSLYGYSMVLATEEAIKKVFGNSRSFMFTRSSFPGVGKYSGHWLGDNAANWNDIKWAIPGMLEFSLFGVPYIGADICGFFDDSSEELCRRWMQVGAFYPFSRNHNAQGYKDQDPAAYGADSLLVQTSKHYLNIRYSLLPYLYTLFYRAHVDGETVVRPLMHEFYNSEASWKADRQFMWGKYLLITPVLDPGVETLNTYIPNAVWYNYETEERLSQVGDNVNLYLRADKIGLHIRGGGILPVQRPAVTTAESRNNPLGLIVALDDSEKASGELFWDDGDSRDSISSGKYIHCTFSVENRVLQIQVINNGEVDNKVLIFENITVLGLSSFSKPVTITENNNGVFVPDSSMEYNPMKQVLYLRSLSLKLGTSYKISWNLATIDIKRLDCHPEEDANEAKCKARGCYWEPSIINGVPYCYFPLEYGYMTDGNVAETPSGWTFDILRNNAFPSPRPESADINRLRVNITYLSGHSLRFKIFDPEKARYEVPVSLTLPTTPEENEEKRMYEVEVINKPFGIKVIRKNTRTVIWDSILPGFTFSDMFIQISTILPSQYIYGFGETEHTSYRHDLNYHTWGMFSKDQPPGYKMNCYGVHPFHMGLETTAHAHGILLLNSNAMDVTLQPTPALTYRALGGILDFYVVMGPTPEQVVQQYTAMIGRPVLPAYWSLGFQLCRYGYESDTEIANLYRDMKTAGIPYDVQYADIDYMERQMDFTLGQSFQGLPALVDNMRAEGMRFIFILDPAIAANETQPYPAYERGIAEDVFIKWPAELSNDIVWGKVWPDYPNVTIDNSLDWDTQVELYRAYAAFPDFFKSQTAAWWHREIADFYNNIMKFDGLWIDMNEPASFVHGTVGENCLGPKNYDFPPYMPPLESKHRGLSHKTLCMNSQQFLADGTPVKHYDVHNLYGWSHTKPTYDALLDVTGKRGIVVTRSTYPSSGKWAGHWLGDNNSSWDQLFKSIIGMLEFSLFGISYTGADICGFFNTATYEMCLRWMQLGAFYPYSRNHNGKGSQRQDPVAWNDTFAETSRDVLNIRYTLLPYLYTLMYEAHIEGSTVIRPLLHEFVNDKVTWDIHRQFLWGPALLITPVLDEGMTEVSGYLPNTRWYNYHTAEAVNVRSQFVNMPAPFNQINLHVRGGYILPCQKPEPNTRLSRTNPLDLIVALGDDGSARGSLFWDDGERIELQNETEYLLTTFDAYKKTLTNRVIHNGLQPADELKLGMIKVWGAGALPVLKASLKANRAETPLTFNHNANTEVLTIDATATLQLLHLDFTITWSTEI